MKKSRILTEVKETARGLNRVGVLDQPTMREFDVLAVSPVRALGAANSSDSGAHPHESSSVCGSAQHQHFDLSEMGNWCEAAEWSVAETSQRD
jgi:hypothetical protein